MSLQTPEFSENLTIAKYDVTLSVFKKYDSFTEQDYHDIHYSFAEELEPYLKSVQEQESEKPEFYGACPFVTSKNGKSHMWVSVPIGEHNHETPLTEVERVAHGFADLVENYISEI